MNAEHRCACASDEWREVVRDHIIPWVLTGVDLGDDALELGPGFGATTDVLRELAPRWTAVEIDVELAGALAARLAGTNVTVLTGDATALNLDGARFSGVVSFSMLHHVHSAELQDRLFAEARRVLRPGGVFAASDSLDDPGLREFHRDDTFVPVDPAALPARLAAAGFADISVETNPFAWKAIAFAR